MSGTMSPRAALMRNVNSMWLPGGAAISLLVALAALAYLQTPMRHIGRSVTLPSSSSLS